MFCFLALLDIYLVIVIYKLLKGSRSLFALALLLLSSLWQLEWLLYALSVGTVNLYMTWALQVQCWIFANRYYHSYLKSKATTTEFTLRMHIYTTVIYLVLIVALSLALGYTASLIRFDFCYQNNPLKFWGCYWLEVRNNLIQYSVMTWSEVISATIALYSIYQMEQTLRRLRDSDSTLDRNTRLLTLHVAS